MIALTQRAQVQLDFWLPALIAGGLAWGAFLFIGHTPVLRASGLALVIVGMGLALRRMGPALTIIGALALAFSPSFWIQTGGAESLQLIEVAAALVGSVLLGLVILALSRHPLVGVSAALIVFAALFLLVVGTPRSLRLTTLLTAWTLFLLVDSMLVSNPRPDEPPTGALGPHHTWGLLILFGVGVFNDPLFVLLAPALWLGLFLSKQRLPLWYWGVLLALSIYGSANLIAIYISPDWWAYPTDRALAQGLQLPVLIADGWREPARWIGLINLIAAQFTAAGAALGLLGLARLARWYPPVGVVLMIAYGTYATFGLVYFGADSSVLLLPLLMIQLFWMTYAVYTFSQWLQKSFKGVRGVVLWFAPAAFTLLPLLLLWRIMVGS